MMRSNTLKHKNTTSVNSNFVLSSLPWAGARLEYVLYVKLWRPGLTDG